MKATTNKWWRMEKNDFANYLSQINLDAFFLKAQLVVSGVVILVLLAYFILFT